MPPSSASAPLRICSLRGWVDGDRWSAAQQTFTANSTHVQDSELDELKDKFKKLRTDFVYNVEVRQRESERW